jgi:hypothetical protein
MVDSNILSETINRIYSKGITKANERLAPLLQPTVLQSGAVKGAWAALRGAEEWLR